MRRVPLLFALTIWCTPIWADESPTRPPIKGIADVVVSVSFLEQAPVFYTGFLSLADASKDPSCLGMERCIRVNSRQRIELTQAGTPPSRSLLDLIVFETSNLDQLRAYLTSHGVSVHEFRTPAPGVRWIRIADPEGHRIGFVQTNSNDFKANAGQVSQRLIHAGFVVRDRAAEDKFYKDILGFHVYWHGGMKDDQTNWVDMQVPDGTDWIEYMLNVSPDASHKTLGVMNHIAMGVSDIHAAEKQLRANGWTGAEQPKIGRDGKWQLNLYDPDDTRVEFMEFTPTQKPCCSEYSGPHPKP
jgi:catechol 2,3-dioxygenase-like lactoylglutathione lyase family enzyme